MQMFQRILNSCRIIMRKTVQFWPSLYGVGFFTYIVHILSHVNVMWD